jgi:morphogenesis family protein
VLDFSGTRVELDDALAMLSDVERRTVDLRRVFMGEIDSSVTEFFEQQFLTEGARGGQPWAPVSQLTSKLRRRPGHGHEGPTEVLQDANVMWGSFVKSGGPDSVRVIEPQRYVRGSAVPYAAAHQKAQTISKLFGRPLKHPKTVPARPVVPATMPADLIRSWENMVVRHLESR